MTLHAKYGLKRPVLPGLSLLIATLLLPVGQASGQSIKTDGDIVADGVSLQELKAEYCAHLEQLHVGAPLPLSCTLPAGKRLVFVTSAASDSGGNLVQWANNLTNPTTPFTDGLLAADAICQYHADNATTPLPGTYKAWLSTDSVNAKDRIGDHPWTLPDGTTVVADSLADLLNCSPTCIQNPINQTEAGAPPPARFTFTGTNEFGERTAPADCTAWTTGSPLVTYNYGSVEQNDSQWTADGLDGSCSFNDRIYCFGN